MDGGIERGYNWIVEFVVNHWTRLDARVQLSVNEENEAQRQRLIMLRNKYGSLEDNMIKDNSNEDKNKMKENPFRPIEEIVEELNKQNENKSNYNSNHIESKNKQFSINKKIINKQPLEQSNQID